MIRYIFLFLLLATSAFAYTEPPEIAVTKPSGTTYTVCSSGCDFSTLEGADGSVSAGDIIQVKAGTYSDFEWNQSGSSGNPIWIEAFGDGNATFNTSSRIQVLGSYVVFDGGADRELVFNQDNTLSFRMRGDYITVRRCHFRDGGQNYGGQASGSNLSMGSSYGKVYNNLITDADDEGIYVNLTDGGGSIVNAEIRNNIITSRGTGIQFNPHSYSGTVNGTTVVSGNYIYSGGSYYGGNLRAAIVLFSSDNKLKDTVNVFNNMIYDYYYGIKAPDGGPMSGVTFNIFNNTIYDSGSDDFQIASNAGGTYYIRNNISTGSRSISSTGNSVTQSDWELSPSFVSTNSSSDDFLKITASNNGYDTNGPVTDDYFGYIRSLSAPDIGADEYGEAGPDVIAPTVTTKIIQTDGVSLFLTFDEGVVINNSTGFTIAGAVGGIQISSCDTNSTPMDCTLDGIVLSDDTGITLTYSGAPADAIEDIVGNDLADFADSAITNNSIQEEPDTVPPTLSSATIATAGLTIIMAFNESVTEAGTGSNWSFTMSGGAVTLSAPSVNGNEITYTLSRTVQNDETLSELDYTQPGDGIEDIADNDLASINNYSGTFNNNSTEGLPIWGDNTTAGTRTSDDVMVRLMGGTSPDIENMILEEIHCYMEDSGTTRLAVYQGGALDDPTGAALVWDAGTQTVPAEVGWVSITGGTQPLAANEVTWIGWKSTGTYLIYFNDEWDSGSDFQSARGRFNSTTESTSTSDAWDDPIAATGAFADYWYTCYIVYSQSSDITPPTLEDVTITESGNTIIMDFSEEVTESGTGSDWLLVLNRAGGKTLSSPSVDVDKITYTLSNTAPCEDTLNELDYTQPGDGIQDTAGNDLATIDDFSGTFLNSSTECIPTMTGLSIGKLP